MAGAWAEADLAAFGDAEEMDVASLRDDGSRRPYVTVWMVRLDDDLVIRSAYGPDNGWYRRAAASGQGRIRLGDREWDVEFGPAEPDLASAIDVAYLAKYQRHPKSVVDTVVSADARRSTLRVTPR